MHTLVRFLIIFSFSICPLVSHAQTPPPLLRVDPAIERLRAQDLAVQTMHAVWGICDGLFNDDSRFVCSGIQTTEKATAFVNDRTELEKPLICDELVGVSDNDTPECKQKPTSKHAFEFVSGKLCGGCITSKMTISKLHIKREEVLVRLRDEALQHTKEAKATLVEIQQQLTAAQGLLDAKASELARLSAAAVKIRACKEEARHFLPVVAKKKP